MDFFARVGIDLKLLLAQVINFGILLWLLKKFLYRPIIEKIESEERELEKAKITEEKLSREREKIFQMREKILKEAREKAKSLIKEAEIVAEEIRKQAQLETEKIKTEIIQQTERELENQKAALRKKTIQKLKKEIEENLIQYFRYSFSNRFLRDLQNAFLKDLSEKIKQIKLDPEKTDRIVLEYALPLKKDQKEKLYSLLLKKKTASLGNKLIERENKNLLAGFRLEIPGQIIESNLLDAIKNAEKNY